jgi:hypothetical protein
MEDAFGGGCGIVFILGYGALSYGVGVFASNRGRSFGIFFVLALLLNPVIMFIVAALLSAITDTTDTSASSTTVSTSAGGGAPPVAQSGSELDDPENASDRASAEKAPEKGAEEETSETADGFAAGEESSESDERISSDRYDPPAEEEPAVGEDSLGETYEEDTSDRTPEGKVRCDTCYSFVDESASECPACGSPLNSGGGFF